MEPGRLGGRSSGPAGAAVVDAGRAGKNCAGAAGGETRWLPGAATKTGDSTARCSGRRCSCSVASR
ncbi:hypothetical protein M5585_07275 [Serratia ureilytica]